MQYVSFWNELKKKKESKNAIQISEASSHFCQQDVPYYKKVA